MESKNKKKAWNVVEQLKDYEEHYPHNMMNYEMIYRFKQEATICVYWDLAEIEGGRFLSYGKCCFETFFISGHKIIRFYIEKQKGSDSFFVPNFGFDRLFGRKYYKIKFWGLIAKKEDVLKFLIFYIFNNSNFIEEGIVDIICDYLYIYNNGLIVY